ncbi:MAG: hypothetical protein LBC86_07920 [Oscillospiraceae bacterium]|jgi:hypothetical protein|nr:hypothetical protein [Oscillospiraceae bacterium]
MKVIKSHTYNIINPEPFEIPYPLVFELLSGNTLLAEYTISETGVVDYSFNPNAGEKILTSIRRPLLINDVYFLFSSRIFPDKTPYTAIELERFELDEYHPYAVIRRTRGMLPGDKYWLRFENEEINYKAALQEHRGYYDRSYQKYMDSLEAATDEPPAAPLQSVAAAPEQPAASDSELDVMSEDMIFSLMNSMSGELSSADSNITGEPPAPEELAAEETSPASDGGMMSEDAIAAMLAANSAPEEPAAEETAPASDGGMMSEDAIAAMLAAAQ